MPSAAEMDVDEWAVPKESYSLSSLFGKPDMPSNSFSRMKTCVEKGFLDKGKPIWVEAEMSYYQKKMISDEAWEKISSSVSDKILTDLFGSTENPSKGKFPRFKVTDWDFAIPKDYLDARKEIKEAPSKKLNDGENSGSSKKETIQPLSLSGRFSS